MKPANYPMAYFDMVRAMLDGMTDAEIADRFADECERRAKQAYAQARDNADNEDAAKYGRVVNHNTSRAKFWKRAGSAG
jgi:hypothetical protein